MRARSRTTLPGSTAIIRPYAMFLPVLSGHSGMRRAFATRTTRCVSSTEPGRITAAGQVGGAMMTSWA
jgi:hypothetical protein